MLQYSEPSIYCLNASDFSIPLGHQQYLSISAFVTGETCDGGPLDTESGPPAQFSIHYSIEGGQIIIEAITSDEGDPELIGNRSGEILGNGNFSVSTAIPVLIHDRGCDVIYSITGQGHLEGDELTGTGQAVKTQINPSDPDCQEIFEGSIECTRFFTIEGAA